MGKYDWLDKHIKAQAHNRKIVTGLVGKNPARVQELAEANNWDRPKRKRR